MNLTKFLNISGGMTAAFVAVMALMHTPQGLRLWGRMRGSEGCPYGMDGGATPKERDARRATQAASLRGDGRARSTAFLGFELNKTSRADVDAWAKAQAATCRVTRTQASDLECNVPAGTDAAGKPTEAKTLFFVFDSRRLLKSVHAMTDYADAEAAALAFAHRRAGANSSLGSEPRDTGEPNGAYLSAGLLRQVAAEYRLENVFARLSATHMTHAYIVEEQYRAIAD